jgi:hypothetical protein
MTGTPVGYRYTLRKTHTIIFAGRVPVLMPVILAGYSGGRDKRIEI